MRVGRLSPRTGDMLEGRPQPVEKKEPSTETDEGLGSSGRLFGSGSLGSGSAGSGSLYLSDSQDWVVSPSCSPDEGPAQQAAIPPALAQETLRYMTYLALDPSSYSQPGSQSLSKVLSDNRVEQMTRSYNDVEVVTHLLAERDRDLELAARIGQSLLQRNQQLQERNEALEEQLAQAGDQVQQLQHELGQKDDLLRMVASASEENEGEAGLPPPQQQPPGGGQALLQLRLLQDKLQELEEENQQLRSQACQLRRDTVSFEQKEQRLVSDCVEELRQSSSSVASMAERLSQSSQELQQQQEQSAQLLAQIVQLQLRLKQLALEKEELRMHLQASKEAQRQLTAELNELAETNAECVEMLHECQQEIRELRCQQSPSAGGRRQLYSLCPMDSLAAEIEGTMRRELSVEEEVAVQDQRASQRRVFQTVRSANASRVTSATPPIPGSGALVMTSQPFQSSQGEEAALGRPGCPGGGDLGRALHRLALRRHNFLSERQFFQAERDRKQQEGGGSGGGSPVGSAFSSFSNLSDISISSSLFRSFLPEKLQIVKPMEGSLTLHHWQQLATPHLASILDPPPGVVTKGFRPLARDAPHMEEDQEEQEEKEVQGRGGALEKGAAEFGKKEEEQEQEEEEEEEGGITFRVRCSSTPEDGRRSSTGASTCPPSAPGPPPGPPAAPGPPASLTAASQSHASASCGPNPGKSYSFTSSTCTITTCRILHPSTPPTQLTPSSLRTGPSTPLTPCSLGDSLPPRHPPGPPPPSLASLLLERGISAQGSGAPPPPSASPPPSPSPPRPPPADHFLASRPAELFLQDVYGRGGLGRAPHPDLPSPCPPPEPPPPSQPPRPPPAGAGLLQRLRRLGLAEVAPPPPGRREAATFVSAGGGSLMDGLRRNQSLPALIGARGGADRKQEAGNRK